MCKIPKPVASAKKPRPKSPVIRVVQIQSQRHAPRPNGRPQLCQARYGKNTADMTPSGAPQQSSLYIFFHRGHALFSSLSLAIRIGRLNSLRPVSTSMSSILTTLVQ